MQDDSTVENRPNANVVSSIDMVTPQRYPWAAWQHAGTVLMIHILPTASSPTLPWCEHVLRRSLGLSLAGSTVYTPACCALFFFSSSGLLRRRSALQAAALTGDRRSWALSRLG